MSDLNDRYKKLLAIANDPASPKPEAETARTMAEKIRLELHAQAGPDDFVGKPFPARIQYGSNIFYGFRIKISTSSCF